MIQNKTIYIAHNWSDVSLAFQSKALALALSGKNTVVFLNAKKNGFNNVSINKNLVVLEWPGKRPTGLKDLLFAVKLMKKNKPDIVITNFAANDIMLFVSWLFNVKIRICYFHTMVQQHIADHRSLPINQRINIFRKGLAFRLATHMLPSTHAAKNDLTRFYKVKENKAFVFPNVIDDTNWRNKNNDFTIGFLGRLERSKGVDILIEAFKQACGEISNIRLEIVGLGTKEQELKKHAEILGLNDKIFFKGAIPYNAVPGFLSSINFLVLPSRIDNLPTVALEAFSVATPIIGSDTGGIPDIITHGYNGLLFENENPEDLSKKIIQLLADKEKRDVLSVNARKTFEEKYCISKLPEKLERLLESNYTAGFLN